MISRRHRECIDQGRFLATLNGVRFGRRPRLTRAQVRKIKQLARDDYPLRAIAVLYKVSASTISRVVSGRLDYAS